MAPAILLRAFGILWEMSPTLELQQQVRTALKQLEDTEDTIPAAGYEFEGFYANTKDGQQPFTEVITSCQ
jgi:hypothetical protein